MTQLSKLEQLRVDKSRLLAEANDIVRDGSDDLEGAQLQRFEEIEAALDALAPELEALEARAVRIEQIQRDAHRWVDGSPNTSSNTRPNDVRGRALAYLESREQPQRNADIIQAAVRTVEHDPTGKLAERAAVSGDPAYTSAFLKTMRDPVRGHLSWTDDEQRAWRAVDQFERALGEGSTGTGGALIPFVLDPAIIVTGAGSINPLRQIARVIQTGSNNWHGVAAGQVQASFDPEGEEVSDDSPTFVAPTVTIETERFFVPVSLELIDDTPTLAEEVSRLFADATDNLERDKYTNGTGTLEPAGVVYRVQNTTASRVAVTTGGTFGAPDVYKLIEALPARHQDAAQWMGSLNVLNKIRQFATGSGPQSAFWADFAGPTLNPAKLLGAPIWQNSAMVTSVTTGADFLMVGDFSRFNIVDHIGGSHLEIVPHIFGTTNGYPVGVRGYFGWRRTGSNTTDNDAFRILPRLMAGDNGSTAVPTGTTVLLGYIHADTVHASFLHSVLALVAHDAGAHLAGWCGMRAGAGHLSEARNKVVCSLLDSDADHLLFVDSDMGFPPDALERLLAHGRDVVGALCFALDYTEADGCGGYRAEAHPVLYAFGDVGNETGFIRLEHYAPDTLMQVAGTGCAFVLVHRSVYDAIAQRSGPAWYDRLPNPTTGELLSEDLSFCVRCAAAGVPVYVDTGVKTTHAKTAYVGEQDYVSTSQRCEVETGVRDGKGSNALASLPS